VVPISPQSVIYWPNGSVKQVIGGNAAAPTAVPVVSATPKPPVSATTAPTVVPPTVTAVPGTPSATQTKSPGFEIFLAAIGMVLALALISRKK
jgi:PGF-CTERM motif